MTLDEAIKHSEEVAERYEKMEDSHDEKLKEECLQCAADHRQLAEWLKELKQYKEIVNRIYNETTNDHYGNALTALDNIDKILDETRCLWNKED